VLPAARRAALPSSSTHCCRHKLQLLREAPEDFTVLVERVARQLQYPPAFVERDYWITEILRSIARPIPEYDATVIFKGGTSLSKGWRLIQRMSEDVDVLVTFGEGVSRAGKDRVLKLLIDRVATDIGLEATGQTGETSVHRARSFRYPQLYAHGALTGERVLLELGTRGGPEPHHPLELHSLIAEVALHEFRADADTFQEFAPVTINTLAPERTLFEKLAALHHLAAFVHEEPAVPSNLGTKLRHAYDIAMLLEHDTTLEALGTLDVKQLVADIERRSLENAWAWTPRPEAGYADSRAFSDEFISDRAVASAYDQALQLVVRGPKPSLPAVAQLVKSRANLL
jgi:predicted nucleotidyltransferase component of viral defense system